MEAEPLDKIFDSAEKLYKQGYDLISREGQRDELAYDWKVKLPSFNLLDITGDHYFQRYRWFEKDFYPVAGRIVRPLKSIAPAFVEKWETWKEPTQWIDLLSQWHPEQLQKLMGSSIAALQLVVDVADHLLTREVLALAEKSPIMTALLTSAELLLKWPAQFLTQMHQERNHPLDELKTYAQRQWAQRMVQMSYLRKSVTTCSETLKTAQALHTELVHLLQNKISKSQASQAFTKDDLLQRPKASKPTKSSHQEPSAATANLQGPTVQVTLTIRKRTPQDCLLEEMSRPSKLRRHESERGFRA